MSKTTPKLDETDCESTPRSGSFVDANAVKCLDLNLARIEQHAERVGKATRGEVVTTLPCLGPCTTNNGAVISWKRADRFTESDLAGRVRAFADSAQKYWNSRYLITCIPAAGAASRYLSSVRKFVNHFEGLLREAHALDAPSQRTQTLSEGLPPLAEHARRALRAEMQTLHIPADLRNLTDAVHANYPAVASLSSQAFGALSKHLTSGSELDKGLIATRRSENQTDSRPDSHESDSAPSGDDTPWLWDETIIRTHWDGSGADRQASSERGRGKVSSAAALNPLFDEPMGAISNHSPLRIIHKQSSDTGSSALAAAVGSDGPLKDRESDVLAVYCASRSLLDAYEALPKAFVPTTAEGDDFLFLKIVEQMSLIPCLANAIVCPSGMTAPFETRIRELGKKLLPECRNLFELARTPFCPPWVAHWGRAPSFPGSQSESLDRSGDRGTWFALEQGNELSTIRFLENGKPFQSEAGSYSRVSAGHGELVHLFSDILGRFPEAECLHIRNIDNVIGTGTERRREIQTPARLFRVVRDCLEVLRWYFDGLASGTGKELTDWKTKEQRAKGALVTLADLAEFWHRPTLAELDPAAMCRFCAEILGSLFHWPATDAATPVDEKARTLSEWLSRPLSVFGVVRKEAGDVGGGPVFARLPNGESIKLCMEMPHATDGDRELYFGARGKATHFNPVLVFFELQTHKDTQNLSKGRPNIGRPVDFARLFDDRFWLLAQKEFEGTKVCYHETVLYELIGNSARTNLIFVEVPRTLFNPHKSFIDGLGQDRRSYGFGETLRAQDERPDSF